MATSQVFDWKNFLPDFDKLLAILTSHLGGGAQGGYFVEGNITDYFALIIFSFFIIFLTTYSLLFIKYNAYIVYLHHKIKNLQADHIFDLATWDKLKHRIPLFERFSEILTKYRGKLYTQYDSDMYFSGKTLAPSLLHSKIFPFISVLLTGLGVLGTFMGLQMGLSGLLLDGNTEHLQSEIRLMAQGASIAFSTSVYGVGTSLLLNLLEKIFSAITRRHINKLQTQISTQFPPFPSIDVFLDMERHEAEAKSLLAGLAEQIGYKMQQSLDTFSQGMAENLSKNISEAAHLISDAISESLKSSINATLAPEIQTMSRVATDLGNKQLEHSTNTMETLITQFMTSISSEGENQRNSMTLANKELEKSLSSFTHLLQNITQNIDDGHHAIIKNQENTIEKIRENIEYSTTRQNEVLHAMNAVVSHNVSATKGVIEQGKSLHTNVTQANDMLLELGKNIHEASNNLATSSAHLETFAGDIKVSIDRSSTSVERAMTTAQKVAEIHHTATTELASMRQPFEQLRSGLSECAKQLEVTIKTLITSISSEGENQRNSMTLANHELEKSLVSFTHLLQNITQNIDDGHHAIIKNQENTIEKIRENIEYSTTRQNEVLQAMNAVVSHNVDATKGVIEQGKNLHTNVTQANDMLLELGKNIHEASNNLATSSAHLETFAGDIKVSIDRSSSSVERAMTTAQKVAEIHHTATTELASMRQPFEQLRSGLTESAEHVVKTLESTQQGFGTLVTQYSALQVKLHEHMEHMEDITKKNVEELDAHMAKLLQEYAALVNSQVRDRMTAWDTQTKAFCESMANVVGAMTTLVEELDQRPQK